MNPMLLLASSGLLPNSEMVSLLDAGCGEYQLTAKITVDPIAFLPSHRSLLLPCLLRRAEARGSFQSVAIYTPTSSLTTQVLESLVP